MRQGSFRRYLSTNNFFLSPILMTLQGEDMKHKAIFLSFFRLKCLYSGKAVKHRHSRRVDEPVEKEVDWYGAEVPHSMSI